MKFPSFILLLFCFGVSSCNSTKTFPESAKVDFKNEVPESEAEIYTVQYKDYSRDQIAYVEQGDVDRAIQFYNDFLEKAPNDVESMFGMAVAMTAAGRLDEAMTYVIASMERGLPLERYLAGPRKLLAPLYASPVFQKLGGAKKTLLHGPTLFSITDESVYFWMRTNGSKEVKIKYWKGGPDQANGGDHLFSKEIETKEADDFTSRIYVDGLTADSEYSYSVFIDGVEVGLEWDAGFWTTPSAMEPATFELGFGGGAGFTPWYERMWNTIGDQSLDAFFLLGDNVYHDVPEHPSTQRYMYYRRQSRPEYRAFSAGTPLFAIWDDHDFGGNDSQGGPGINEPYWKPLVLDIYKENMVSPSYGGGSAAPGVWFDAHIGDVHFIFLDTRYYRSEDDLVEGRTALGSVQKSWLKRTLKNSNATFKVIASSVPISIGTKGSPPDYHIDTWDGFKEEREELWSFIEDEKIEGVFNIAADRHRSDAWFNERSNGYGFYEFMSSRLTNVHTHPIIEASIFGYNEKPSFGRLDFDTTQDDPVVTYTIVNIDGEEIWSMELRRSMLEY